jgi:hypothetical protein
MMNSPAATSAFERFVLWFVVCGVSAAPSFYFGAEAFPEPHHLFAMALGILVFVVGYT